jgi:NTP pyrophosphatase (non-canonical NTP hydrolase)
MTTTTDTLFDHVGRALAWVDAANGRGEHETAMRLLKLVEEAGEVAAAYIGMTGQNPRKGVTHSRSDVADELCDVAVTALVALATITGTADAARAALDAHLARQAPRFAAQPNVQLDLFAAEAAR